MRRRVYLCLVCMVLLVTGCFTLSNGIHCVSSQCMGGVDYRNSLVFLVLGIDGDGKDVARSDMIFLATVNPHDKSLMLTSIPRDTYVEIPGRGKDKINHSYRFGGEKLTKKTIEKFLRLPIDGYVKINMPALKLIIDKIDGINVTVPFDFSYNGCQFHKGKMELDGRQTVAFCRMRKKDPAGDMGRNRRHQEVMKAIIQKVTSPYIMFRIVPVVRELTKSVVTDVPVFTILQMAYMYHDMDMKNVVTNRLEGNGILMNGIYYYVVENNEVDRVRKIIFSQGIKGRAL